jgi:spore germination protein GerM
MRKSHRRGVVLIAVLVLALLSFATSGCTDSTEPDEDHAQEDTSQEAGSASDDADGDDSDASEPETLTVMVYFSYGGDRALAVEREIDYTQAVGAAAMEELLAGPTDAEQETWPLLDTAIPEGTELLGLAVSDGVARVDLSSEFESGGGTWSVTARLAQVVYTLAQFDTVDAVEFSIDGEVVELFSGEGLVLDGPQSPEDYEQLVPVDA